MTALPNLLAETSIALTLLAAGSLATLAVQSRYRRSSASPSLLYGAGEGGGEPPTGLPSDGGTRLDGLAHRLSPVHPVSGLPMREALLARMTADAVGALGIIAVIDFDRLTAFDPAFGEHVFATVIGRLRGMLPPERVVAQVDRGQVGVWFAGVAVEQIRDQIDAIRYALGDAIDHDGRRVVPEIRTRLGQFDGSEGSNAAAFLARTLASFTLPDSVAAATASPADYAELARERYALEQDLRQAIERRELRLVFQPLIDSSQRCVVGAEALLRWSHAELGEVPPSRFIPVAEEIGLANEIGLWALNTGVRTAREWYDEGLGNLRLAVNVSGHQLEREDLPVVVQRTLQRHELPAAALEIELTESVATSDAAHCRRIFEALRAMGVKLAVDDFGTGYSGFSSLRTLAFDKIKIDREFVTEVEHRRDSQAICQSILALGRGLGIRVLAEGVESFGELDWLRSSGCRHFQGYYFARPLEPEAFTAFVRDTAGLAALLRPRSLQARHEEGLTA